MLFSICCRVITSTGTGESSRAVAILLGVTTITGRLSAIDIEGIEKVDKPRKLTNVSLLNESLFMIYPDAPAVHIKTKIQVQLYVYPRVQRPVSGLTGCSKEL
jgi:hypothetical protein